MSQPIEPSPTLAARTGQLVQSFLSPPCFSLGSMGGGSQMEAEAIDRWKANLGEQAAELWRDAIGRDPEIVRIVELIQFKAGFVPGSARAIRSNNEIREKYLSEISRIFR